MMLGTNRYGLPGKRTAEVKALLREGLLNKEIADRLRIAERTIRFHVGKLMKTAGLHGRGDERRFMVWILGNN